MIQEDRTKKLLYELLYRLLEWNKKRKKYPKNMDILIEELSKKYDVYLKHQDNEFRDE